MENLSVLELMAELVKIDSQNPGTGEREIAEFVAGFAGSYGLDAEIVETAPGRCNVIVSADAGPGGRHLALSGHLDTKPIGGARSAWRTPPLGLVVADGLAYGLGSSDMKGAIAAMLLAATEWASTASAGRLSLILTADEEAGSNHGAKALAEAGNVWPDAIVIGEPCGVADPWEALFVISRGICCFDVIIEGRQGHSGLSDRLPTSATLAAAKAALALADFEPKVARPSTIPCRPTVNSAVRIEGGVFYGVHPGSARVNCDIRLVPGMDRDDLDRDLRALLGAALPADVTWEIRYETGSLGWMDPAELDTAHPIVSAAQRACVSVFRRELPLAAYPGGTDATYFLEAGIPSIAALGPGWLSVAHGANECVGVDQLGQAQELYRALAHIYASRTRG